MYYGIIALVVILGSAAIYTSRHHRLAVIAAGGTATPPTVGTTWNVGYGIYECDSSDKGKFLPAITDRNNPHGIFTPRAIRSPGRTPRSTSSPRPCTWSSTRAS